ncbi:MAG: type VI secretion lipoprotein TssJ [Deltaproteobacteria bacterium]|jgi:predicted component of type VI protein secretion system|nr:type VI secretion lipoprotein TssJ [Deltaproteobacteria bacterium]
MFRALALILSLFLAACAKPSAALVPNPGPPVKSLDQLRFMYAPKAIRIGVVASLDLNLTEGAPAALAICLYQLSELSWFNGNASTPEGLRQLLSCPGGVGVTPPKGVVAGRRHLFQPGQTQDLVIDRLGEVRYVAVVGGFSDLPNIGATGFLLTPIQENKNFFFANTFEVAELDAWLLLKKQSLVFFPKEKKDLKSSASLYAEKDPQGAPKPRVTVCPAPAVAPAPLSTAPAISAPAITAPAPVTLSTEPSSAISSVPLAAAPSSAPSSPAPPTTRELASSFIQSKGLAPGAPVVETKP